MVSASLKEKSLNINQIDVTGRNAAHYVVQPFEYGSYENTKILELLIASGVDINQQDKQGISPFHLSCLQKSEKLANILKEHGISEKLLVDRKLSSYSEEMELDFEKDADEYIKLQSQIHKEETVKRSPDPQAPQNYSVVDNYDLLMTKVGIKYGHFLLIYFTECSYCMTQTVIYTYFYSLGAHR